jgi:type II secretory pathway component PulF
VGKKKVKLKDLAVFSRQFATMINSGLACSGRSAS